MWVIDAAVFPATVDRTRAGERIRFVSTRSNAHACPIDPGATGVVLCVDWIGCVHTAWDTPTGVVHHAMNRKDTYITMPEEALCNGN